MVKLKDLEGFEANNEDRELPSATKARNENQEYTRPKKKKKKKIEKT